MTPSRPFVRVVKIGGSLLDWPPLPRALEAWLAAQPPAHNILLTGCGKLGDVIRQADRIFSLGEEAAHELCVSVLSVTARLMRALLPQAGFCDYYEQLLLRLTEPVPQSGLLIFDLREFLTDHEPRLPGCPLPHTWAATTDSIAARLAETLNADELVLLKSADTPNDESLANLTAAGHVDAHFPVAAAHLRRVRLINLRLPTDN